MMKKTKLFGMALSAILACTGIVSCNNDDDIAEKPAKHPDYYISYQTSDSNIVRLNKEDVFGGAIVKANTYSRENGYGTLEFHSKVMAVEDGAFYEAKNLTHIKIPGSAVKIGYGAFWRCCSLKSITMPDGITEIGNNAFSDCLSLESITLPDDLTTLGKSAFANCTSLKEITVPQSITQIDQDVLS